MQGFDPRLLRLSIEVDGQLNQYTGLYITATGMKYANPLQNECTVKIMNLRKSVRDYLLTETSPFNRPRRRKRLILEAGRQSIGYFKIFEGDIVEASPSQPPDISLTLKASTGGWWKTGITTASYGGSVPMSTIAKQAAESMGLRLQNDATDKNVANYSYTGSTLRQVDQIRDMGYTTFVDDDTLYVTDIGQAVKGSAYVLSKETGMIGIPQPTEQGVKVRFLLDPQARVGSQISLVSEMNPAVNGDYVVYKLGFDISNRDTAFYSIAEARRVGLWPIVR